MRRAAAWATVWALQVAPAVERAGKGGAKEPCEGLRRAFSSEAPSSRLCLGQRHKVSAATNRGRRMEVERVSH